MTRLIVPGSSTQSHLDHVPRPVLSHRGHRPRMAWITILDPNWCPKYVYPLWNLVPGSVDPRPTTPFLDPNDPDFWQLWFGRASWAVHVRHVCRIQLIIAFCCNRLVLRNTPIIVYTHTFYSDNYFTKFKS